jgi:uncharacterized integral membrane protein (TIGR00697 family)
VTFPIKFWGIHVTWAAFTFPLVVVATDLTVRLISKNPARAVVALAFIPAVIASIAVVYATGAPASVALRIGIASGTAYLVSNLMDVFVFQKIRERWQMWFWAPGVSAIFANVFDTFTFFFVAFYQSANVFMAENWWKVALGQTGAKIFISLLVILPVYGLLLAGLQKLLNRSLLRNASSTST